MAFNYNRGAGIAQNINYKPIANTGLNINGIVQGLKDGNEWKQQQEMKAWLQRAGEDYAAGDDAGFRENYGKANLSGLLNYDQQKQQNTLNNDYRNRALSVQERRLALDSTKGNEPKGEFGYLIESLRSMGVPDEDIQKHITNRTNTLAKGFETVFGQAHAGQSGKSQVQYEYAPLIKEAEAIGTEIGKSKGAAEVALRKDEDMLNNADVRRSDLVDKMSKAHIGYNQNPIAQAIERKTPTALLSSEQQQARQWLQSRGLSETLAMAEKLSGQKSDNDIVFLKAIAAGDITDFTPDQVLGAYDRITENARQAAISNRRVLNTSKSVDYTEYFK